jgi:hypothetical protein
MAGRGQQIAQQAGFHEVGDCFGHVGMLLATQTSEVAAARFYLAGHPVRRRLPKSWAVATQTSEVAAAGFYLAGHLVRRRLPKSWDVATQTSEVAAAGFYLAGHLVRRRLPKSWDVATQTSEVAAARFYLAGHLVLRRLPKSWDVATQTSEVAAARFYLAGHLVRRRLPKSWAVATQTSEVAAQGFTGPVTQCCGDFRSLGMWGSIAQLRCSREDGMRRPWPLMRFSGWSKSLPLHRREDRLQCDRKTSEVAAAGLNLALHPLLWRLSQSWAEQVREFIHQSR